jgi:hypothetical protein
VWGLLFAKLGRVVDEEVDDDVAGRGLEQNTHSYCGPNCRSKVTSRCLPCSNAPMRADEEPIEFGDGG